MNYKNYPLGQLISVAELVRPKPVYLCIFGSQNYEMDIWTDEYSSDIDFKAIIMPTLHNLVRSQKPTSEVINVPTGHVDVKDIRVFFDALLKCNPVYLECFLTEHWLGSSSFKYPRALTQMVVWENRERFINSCFGMMNEKFKALQHPSPAAMPNLKKFGYNPKQLHHLLRFAKMIEDFETCGRMILVPSNKDFLIDVKLGVLSESAAVQLAKTTLDNSRELVNNLLKEYTQQCHVWDSTEQMRNWAFNLTESKIYEKIIEQNSGL